MSEFVAVSEVRVAVSTLLIVPVVGVLLGVQMLNSVAT